jgi:hypothetical protein
MVRCSVRRLTGRLLAASLGCLLCGLLAGACGSPSAPTPPPPPPPPPPANALPIIESIKVKGRRPNQPANFADVSETIDVVAAVHDNETPTGELEFQWTATLGTFEGTGPSVTWIAPASAEAPVDVTLTLKLVEKYGQPGGPKIYQQDVTSSAPVSLHDSKKEVSEMAKQFLLDFSDSSIGVEQVMRNFQPGCYGTEDEADQVAENRRRFRIIESQVNEPATTIAFGGVCPFRGRPGDACSGASVFWRSRDLELNSTRADAGTDWLAAYYYPDQRRWRLCDSTFDGQKVGVGRPFMR